MKLSFALFFSFSLLFQGGRLYAAACCSAGGSATPIMTEQTSLVARMSLSHSSVVAERYESDKTLFWDDDRKQRTKTVTPSLSYRVSEHWQASLSFDYIAKKYHFSGGGSENHSRPGDSRVMFAYEALYPSPPFVLTPQVFFSVEQTFPTGRGLEQSQSPGLTDVSGQGQGGTSLGAHFFKKMYQTRWSFESRYTYFYPRTLSTNNLGKRSEGSFSLGLQSLNFTSHFDLGTTLSLFLKEGRKSDFSQNPKSERYYELSFYGIIALASAHSLVLSYADQTILGPVYNTSLSRSLSLSYSFSVDR